MCTLLMYSSAYTHTEKERKERERERKKCSLEQARGHISIVLSVSQENGTKQTDQSFSFMVYNSCCINSYNSRVYGNETMLLE